MIQKTHYYTGKFKMLCNQKHSLPIKALSRFSYKIGESDNCKMCERLLKKYQEENKNRFKCESELKCGYKTDCHWRKNNTCCCIDDCAFKVEINNIK